jgi:hypothetical protein
MKEDKETCSHQWKTTDTVAIKAHLNGEKKFRSSFEKASEADVNLHAVRRKVCANCGVKKTTVELDWEDFRPLLPSDDLKKVRQLLIKIALGKEKDSKYPKRITYKELWEKIHPETPWLPENFRKFTRIVVDWLVDIANQNLENGEPPLNSLVVRSDTGMPGDDWKNWAEAEGCQYKTADEAQNACWCYRW